jgi:DNA-binding CsgD family transcriptional regulator
MGELPEGDADLSILTDRQREVGQLLARHLSYKEIGREMSISEDRVYRLAAGIRKKLHVNSRREIAELFIAARLPSEWPEKPVTGKSDLLPPSPLWPMLGADEPYVLREPEVGNLTLSARPTPEAPRVVPRLLDGKHRVLVRLGTIAAIIFAILALMILTVAAIRSVSEMVKGTQSDQALQTRVAREGRIGRSA